MNDIRVLLPLALIALAGWLLYLLAPVLTPFLVSGLLAYLGNPVVSRLVRWHLPRPLAVSLVFLLFLLSLLVLLLYLIPAIQNQIMQFIDKMPVYLDWLQNTALPRLQAWLGVKLVFNMEMIRKALTEHWREAGDVASSVILYITRSGWSVIGWFANLMLIPVVTFYLLLDWEKAQARALALIPARMQARARELARETDEVLGSFLRGQLLVMLSLAIFFSVSLSFMGLDLALPIGVLAGLVSFVPYMGFISGLLASTLAAYLQFHDALSLLWVAGIFLVGQVLESFWLTPRLVGNRIGLHPVTVIFAIMAGGQLFGFTGVLLALPAAAVLKVWLRNAHQFYNSNHHGGEKHPQPERPSP